MKTTVLRMIKIVSLLAYQCVRSLYYFQLGLLQELPELEVIISAVVF